MYTQKTFITRTLHNMNNNIKRKDWVGGSAAVFKTLGASNHTTADRQSEDYYATEPTATEWLCKLERFEAKYWNLLVVRVT